MLIRLIEVTYTKSCLWESWINPFTSHPRIPFFTDHKLLYNVGRTPTFAVCNATKKISIKVDCPHYLQVSLSNIASTFLSKRRSLLRHKYSIYSHKKIKNEKIEFLNVENLNDFIFIFLEVWRMRNERRMQLQKN